jgi:hypothetical protein
VTRSPWADRIARHARWGGVVFALPVSVLIAATALAHESVWCQEVPRGTRIRAVAHIAIPTLVGLRRGVLPLASRSLRARPGDLHRQNVLATRDHLSRLRTGRMLARFRRAGLLVPVPASTRAYYVVGVPESLRIARPWTKRFIEQLATAKHVLFGTRLRVTSLTRTPARQEALIATKPNAAPARGPIPSTHLTGAAVDIGKASLSARELAWLRTVLHRLTARGLVHAVEEFREPHFHVLVPRRYATYARTLASPLLVGGC